MDVVQESIYQGFVKIRSLRRPEYFVTWMNKIVINNALKFRKKKSCFEPYEEQVGQSSSQGITLDEKIDLYCALKKLKRKTYFVRVRAYKKVNKTIYYSHYSNVKKVKVNK